MSNNTQSHEEYYSVCENSCIILSVAPEDLCQIRENNPDDVIVESSGLSQLVLRDSRLSWKARVTNWDVEFERWEHLPCKVGLTKRPSGCRKV